jgi:acyl-CoA synthetase (AMP-forming)/AMP-acid ligase II
MNNLLNSLGGSLTFTMGKYPQKVAIINYGGPKFTYEEFNERVNRLANALIELGIRKGDKVSYLFFNSNQFLETHYAVAKAGAVGVPLNFRLVGRELAYQINHSDSICLIFGTEFKKLVEEIKSELSSVKYFVYDGEEEKEFLSYEKLIASGKPTEPGIEVNLYDENLILYTAGTTGLPKGVVLTHRNSLFNGMCMVMDYKLSPDDIFQVVPPLFHSASLNGFAVTTVLLGATMVIHKQVNPQDILASIEEHKVTCTWGPATLWRMLISCPEIKKYDLSSVRLVINGAMYMPAEMRKEVLSYFPNAVMGDTYGMTEASPCTTILRPTDALRKPASVGVPLTICDVKIFDDQGEEVPPGEVGEIVTRGNFMKGYYKNEEATAQAIKGGWFYTGDLGRKDEEGFIYLVDRKKDMIVSGGENVYSKEVEEVIALHPKVFEVAVIGLPDPKWGEVVTAVIVPLPGQELTEQEIIEHCRKNLAGYKCPKIVKFREMLPKNPAGKILKRELREIYKQK